MKKSRKVILIIIAITLIIMSFIGGQAYAKYMSKVTGQGTADIASWSFKVNENEEKLQNISLKSTINNSTLINNKIAPGTRGDFQIKIDATGSEVGINYILKFENETTKPTNLKFTYKDKTYNTITELQEELNGTINADEQDKTKTIVIGWFWNYETGSTEQEISANDIIDTKEAKQIRDYNFDVIVTGTQVNPQN